MQVATRRLRDGREARVRGREKCKVCIIHQIGGPTPGGGAPSTIYLSSFLLYFAFDNIHFHKAVPVLDLVRPRILGTLNSVRFGRRHLEVCREAALTLSGASLSRFGYCYCVLARLRRTYGVRTGYGVSEIPCSVSAQSKKAG